jgi:hypothetical protein
MLKHETLEQLKDKTINGSKYEAIAAAKRLADKGRLSANMDGTNAEQIGKMLMENPALNDSVFKNDRAAISAAAIHTADDSKYKSKLNSVALKTATKTKLADLDPNQIEYLKKNAPGHLEAELSDATTFNEFMKNSHSVSKAMVGQFMAESEHSADIYKSLGDGGIDTAVAKKTLDAAHASYTKEHSKEGKVANPLDIKYKE